MASNGNMLGMICKCSTKSEICVDIDKSRKEVHKKTCLVLTPFQIWDLKVPCKVDYLLMNNMTITYYYFLVYSTLDFHATYEKKSLNHENVLQSVGMIMDVASLRCTTTCMFWHWGMCFVLDVVRSVV